MIEMKRIQFQAFITKYAFVAPADLNYLNSRMSRMIGVSSDFYWNAAQALEKYMKAIIVANGFSAKDFKHDLGKLYAEVCKVLGDNGILKLDKPERLVSDLWTENPIERILGKVNSFGDPNIRYGLVNHYNDAWDIFVLDAFVWELRRRTVGMTWVVGEDWIDEGIPEFKGMPLSVVIKEQKLYQPRNFNIPKSDFQHIGSSYQDILSSWNFHHCRDEADIAKPAPASFSSVFGSMTNSPIWVYLDSVDGEGNLDKETKEELILRLNWVKQNIHLGPVWSDEFSRVIKSLK